MLVYTFVARCIRAESRIYHPARWRLVCLRVYQDADCKVFNFSAEIHLFRRFSLQVMEIWLLKRVWKFWLRLEVEQEVHQFQTNWVVCITWPNHRQKCDHRFGYITNCWKDIISLDGREFPSSAISSCNVFHLYAPSLALLSLFARTKSCPDM